MWIKSQFGKELIDITGKRLFVWNSKKEWCIYVDPMTTNEDVSFSIGRYETQERAVQILEEIESHLVKASVYKMPEK